MKSSWQIPPKHQSKYLGGSESESIEIPPFQTQMYLVKIPLNVNIVKNIYFIKNSFENFMKWGLKGGISIDADSGPPKHMHFDAAVVFVKKTSLSFRLALAILCSILEPIEVVSRKDHFGR